MYPGPRSYAGEPSWSLHDPVRNLFFRLDWLAFEILSRWSLGDPQRILQDVNTRTLLQAEVDDIEAVLRFLLDNELLQARDQQSIERLHQQRLQRSSGLTTWLMHRYLFFRVPLWKPDAWLTKSQRAVAFFYRPGFLWLTLVVLVLGLLEVSRQWEPFVATLVDVFSWSGLVSFSIALVFVKFMHELGHAFTAKRFGVRVPTMGVAFLVMFPMAYTDVNEVWKLPSRRQRLLVGSAGILTELIIAAWATFFWGLLPDGLLRGAVFVLATTTWVSTLIINASPFLRFDGYFLLMDWLGMSNLHQRASALGQWRLRELLFGLGDEPPEILPRRRQRGLILFAYATWLYRLVVFVGIAVLVYVKVPKPLGPLLAALELWWFICLPVVKEMGRWGARRPEMLRNRRPRWVLVAVVLALAVALVPWDRRIHTQGLLIPVDSFPLVAPEGARLAAFAVESGDWVEEGEVILELDSPDLDYRQRMMEVREQSLGWQKAAAGVAPELLEQLRTLEAEGAELQAELVGVRDEKNRFQLKAPMSGQFFPSNINLRPNTWVGRNERLGTLIDPAVWQVMTYLPESALKRVSLGDHGLFYPESAAGGPMSAQVSRIDLDATRVLDDGLLAATRGGQLPVRESEYGLVPESAVYRVVLAVEPGQTPEGVQLQRGKLLLFGARASWLGEYARGAATLLVRELGF
ncbi:type I secretion membrane fusion protein, HlyD family [Thiorhodovibrio winogradskyi]|uniref:Type I secretion membrane fusion protein, HlyD family n=1 Tax=Thiorhodovibrio winogradskyi TaxID=77007 RepID=A0ABZ0S7H6_9GAMM